MSLSKERQEYHLTPMGWVEGSFYGDALGGQNILPVPSDRVLTIDCFDELPAAFAKPHFYDHVSWESDDSKVVTKLKAKFGDRPDWFGYKKM